MKQGSPFAVALVASMLVTAWLTATVQVNYSGHWSALFCIGETYAFPPSVLAEKPYRFAGSNGFDGQGLLLIARDPWIQGEEHRYVDAAWMRYRRILVPGLAWAVAFGQKPWIWGSFIAVLVASLALGVGMSAALARGEQRSGWWGLLFLLFPPVLISVDRMVVDGTFLAVAAGLVWAMRRPPEAARWPWLAALPLVRETGWVVIGAAGLWELSQRRWAAAVGTGLCGLPALAWSVWLAQKLPPASAPLDFGLLGALWYGWTHPDYDASRVPLGSVVRAFDGLSIAAMGVALALSVWWVVRRPRLPEAWMAAAFGVLWLTLRWDHAWTNVYGFGRTAAPVFLWLAAASPWRRTALLLMAPVTARVLIQMAPQALGLLGLRLQ